MSNSQFNPINPPENKGQIQNKSSTQLQQEKQYQKLDTEQKIRSDEQAKLDRQNRLGSEDKKEEERQKTQSEKEKEDSKENLERVKDLTNSMLSQMNIKLDYAEDDELNETIVKVMNRETDELIRQIPAEEMLELAKKMEEMTGMLVDRWS